MSCKCDFGKGLLTCHCSGCCRTFTSPSAFSMHQRIPGKPGDWGLVVCLNPAEMFRRNGDPMLMPVRETPDGSPVWGHFSKQPNPYKASA